MGDLLSAAALDQLFREARSHNGWQDTPVPKEKLVELYDLMKMGPTGANCCPMRIVFVTSQAQKEKLKPALDGGNVEKAMSAPVVAILAYDLEFYKKLNFLFPHDASAPSWYEGKPEKIQNVSNRTYL